MTPAAWHGGWMMNERFCDAPLRVHRARSAFIAGRKAGAGHLSHRVRQISAACLYPTPFPHAGEGAKQKGREASPLKWPWNMACSPTPGPGFARPPALPLAGEGAFSAFRGYSSARRSRVSSPSPWPCPARSRSRCFPARCLPLRPGGGCRRSSSAPLLRAFRSWRPFLPPGP